MPQLVFLVYSQNSESIVIFKAFSIFSYFLTCIMRI
jgi:hypothetical protein